MSYQDENYHILNNPNIMQHNKIVYAIKNNLYDYIVYCIQNHHINLMNHQYTEIAIEYQNCYILDLLLNNEAVIYNPDIGDNFLVRELLKDEPNKEIIKVLLKYSYNPNPVRRADQDSLMCLAVLKGDPEIIKLLHQANSNINELNPVKKSPLDYALSLNRFDLVNLLLSLGAEMDENTLLKAINENNSIAIDFIMDSVVIDINYMNGWLLYNALIVNNLHFMNYYFNDSDMKIEECATILSNFMVNFYDVEYIRKIMSIVVSSSYLSSKNSINVFLGYLGDKLNQTQLGRDILFYCSSIINELLFSK